MNFVKRAWLSLLAKKGRTALLIVITSAIMLFVLAGLLINNAADKSIKNAKANVGATLTLSANRSSAFKKMQSGSSASSSSKPTLKMSSVKLSDAKKIAKLSNVSSYNVTAATSVTASSFSAISTSSSSNQMGGSSSSSSGNITLNGETSTSQTSDFKNGTDKITKGRGITASDEGTNNVVIESELASSDKISVGDTITVKSGSTSYKLKVVGIYKSTSSTSTQMGPGASDPANTIYSSYTLANTIKGSKYANTADSVTFTVSAPSKISSVKAAGNKLINTSKYSLATNDSSYQMVKSAMSSVKSFSSKIVWLVSIAGTIILALIVILMVRERRHEIGILLSMGEKRWEIIGQLFSEMVLVLVVGLVIAGIGGQFVGEKLGNQLVTQQSSSSAGNISAPGDQSMKMSGQPGGSTNNVSVSGSKPSGSTMGGGMSGSASNSAQSISVNLSMVEMVELGGFGLAIMFLSVLIASGGILRLNPKKVLIE